MHTLALLCTGHMLQYQSCGLVVNQSICASLDFRQLYPGDGDVMHVHG
jgi:hypothetical protein